MRRCPRLLVMSVLLIASLVSASAALADGITNSGDDLRTGWYPNAKITPGLVKGGTFGKLWSAPVSGQVYAQPLVVSTPTTSSGETVVVATENNEVYGLDAKTGAQNWADPFQVNHAATTPWDPSHVGCADITPSIGTTATPVVDPSTNTVYVTHKVSAPLPDDAEWYLDALDATTGVERPNYPLLIKGTADNNASVTFNPEHEQQRPGLLLLNGVVYLGFGGHCDAPPWTGWVIGVNVASSTPKITAMWEDNASQNGAGIWQAGVGLTSDGPNTILVTTGNGGSPTTPTPGHTPPTTFGESVIRLNVGADGKLTPVDFFAPFDTADLDHWDADFGAGAFVGLPDQYFGTTAHPHLGVAVGKEGYVYLFDRDNLGGLDQGPQSGDNVLQRLGRFGGVWGRPAVWPGDGGWIYVPTSSNGSTLDIYQYGLDGSGQPSLARVGSAPGTFGWGTGSPIVTSDGATSGSELVWIVWSADRTGVGAQLRAYQPPTGGGTLGAPVYSASIGTSANYSIPGVGNDGRLYVGTRDGHVLGFGAPVSDPLTGSPLSFPTTTDGSSSTQSLVLAATRSVKVTGIAVDSSTPFTLGTPSPAVGTQLNANDTLSIPVTFAPTQPGLAGAQVTVTTDSGPVTFSVSGTGQARGPLIEASTSLVSMTGTEVGGHVTDSVRYTNAGDTAATISSVTSPSAPFSLVHAPPVGSTLDAGASVSVEIDFDPTSAGQFSSEIDVTAGNQTVRVGVAASAGAPGLLQFSSQNIDFGDVQVGSTATRTFTLTNAGGTPVDINKSKPPFGGDFTATTGLQEGTTLAPGQTISETVTFTPTATGPATPGSWAITGDDTSGPHMIQFTGTGVAAGGTPTTTTTPSATPPPHTGSHPPSRPVPTPTAPKLTSQVTTTTGLGHTFITYTALVAGTSTFAIQRQAGGRRSHGRCVAVTSRNRRASSCVRWVTVARFTHHDRLGSNRLRLTSMVAPRKLTPGTYRVQSVLRDAHGGRHTFAETLRITAPKSSAAVRRGPARSSGAMLAEIAGGQQRAVAAQPLGAVVHDEFAM